MELVFLISGITMVIAIRKLSYPDMFSVKKIKKYFRHVSDEIGLNKDRRTFLDKQLAISEAKDPLEIWALVTDALCLLKIDEAEIQYNGIGFNATTDSRCKWCSTPIPKLFEGCQHRVFSMDLPLADDSFSYGTLSLKKDIFRDPITPYTLSRIEHLRRTIVNKLHSFK